MSSTVALLTDLVRFPTESRSPNADLIDLYADRAKAAGGVIDVVDGPTGRSNLHVRFGPNAPGGLLLSGHTDVVPAGSGWETDPYQLTEVNGRLCGRGTADMKGFLAAALVVIEALDTSTLRAPIHLALSYDEEIGCVGVQSLLAKLVEDGTCRPDLVVIGEPTQMRVRTGHTGKVAYRIAASARAGHSSRSRTEPTAIGAIVRVAAEICRLNEREVAISANVGTISGGIALNVLSPSCEMTFEVRHQAGIDPHAELAEVWSMRDRCAHEVAAVGGAIEVENLIEYPALAVDPDHPAVSQICGATDIAAAGSVDFGCEAGFYAKALGGPTIILGPGDISDAHKPGEFVDLDQLRRCEKALVDAIGSFCLAPTSGHTDAPDR